MSATDRTGKYNILQVALIYLRQGITAIIKIGSILEYSSGPVFTSLLQIPHIGYVQQLIGNTGTVIPFSAGDPNPIVITNWNTLYDPTYSNGKFRIQYKTVAGTAGVSGDQIEESTAIITRTKDIATNTFQDTVSFDFGIVAYDGQIIIEYSGASLP